MLVTDIKVTISDANGTLLDEGEAEDMGALWREYNAARPARACD